MSNRRYLHKQFPVKKDRTDMVGEVMFKYRDGLYHNIPSSRYGQVAFSFSDIFDAIEKLEREGRAEIVREQVSYTHHYSVYEGYKIVDKTREITANIPTKFRIILDKAS